jgi:hypothetical protein
MQARLATQPFIPTRKTSVFFPFFLLTSRPPVGWELNMENLQEPFRDSAAFHFINVYAVALSDNHGPGSTSYLNTDSSSPPPSSISM